MVSPWLRRPSTANNSGNFQYAYDLHQSHPCPPLYAHLDASIYAQTPIEPQYAPQYAQELYISTHHHPYV